MLTEQYIAPAIERPVGAASVLPRPQGIAATLVFDWGFTVQLVLLLTLFLLGIGPAAANAQFTLGGGRTSGILLNLAFAVTALVVGEGIRRGRKAALVVQTIANSLFVLLGLRDIPATITSVQQGHLGLLMHTLVVLLVSPFLIWLLTRPSTRAWMAGVSSAQASTQHGRRWLMPVVCCTLLAGALIGLGRYL